LVFFWGGLAGIWLFAINTAVMLARGSPYVAIMMVFSLWFGALFLINGALLLAEERTDVSFYDRNLRRSGRKIGLKEVFSTFGEGWWQKICPRQTECTHLAWPGVDWEETPAS
jgi:hypothetical protein